MNLLDYLHGERGRTARVAEACGLAAAFLSQIANGVRPAPAERCAAIEQATGSCVSRWDLRPDDWHLIWPELIRRADAPPEPVPTKAAA